MPNRSSTKRPPPYDPLQYIRDQYQVAAYKGKRVRYTASEKATPREGAITGAEGPYIMIRFDGDKRATGPFHPTDGIEYLAP